MNKLGTGSIVSVGVGALSLTTKTKLLKTLKKKIGKFTTRLKKKDNPEKGVGENE